MTHAKNAVPQQNTIAYKAAFVLFKEGTLSRQALIPRLNVNTKNGNVHSAIDTAIVSGWLTEDTLCRLDIGKRAYNYFSGAEPDPEPVRYVGTTAQPNTIDLMARPPLSRKYLISARGTRDDIPEWSQRETPHFRTQA